MESKASDRDTKESSKETKHLDKKEKDVEARKSMMNDVRIWQVMVVVLAIAAIALAIIAAESKPEAQGIAAAICPVQNATPDSVTKEAAADKALNFINKYMLDGQMTATLKSTSESHGLYSINISVGGRETTVFTSKDGEMLILQGFVIEDAIKQIESQQALATQTPPTPTVPKSDKPVVEAFVMSYCPYGTQIEKGLLPVMKTLGNKADIEIKFVNYAMHGEKEVIENLRQYCIQKDYADKYQTYLFCFLEAGDSASCITKAGIPSAGLQSCMDAADKKYNITAILNNQASWGGRFPPFPVHDAECERYGVQGSPTLIINGVEAQSGRDASSLLKTICAAFNTPPAECSTDMSSEPSPSPGFGYNQGGAATTGGACG